MWSGLLLPGKKKNQSISAGFEPTNLRCLGKPVVPRPQHCEIIFFVVIISQSSGILRQLIFVSQFTPRITVLGSSMSYSLGISNSSYPEPNQSLFLYCRLFIKIYSNIALHSTLMPSWRSLSNRFYLLKFGKNSYILQFWIHVLPILIF